MKVQVECTEDDKMECPENEVSAFFPGVSIVCVCVLSWRKGPDRFPDTD